MVNRYNGKIKTFEKFLFTAKTQRSPSESFFLFNPVRGGIEQTRSGLRLNYYQQSSESFFLFVLSTERKKFFFFALFAALR